MMQVLDDPIRQVRLSIARITDKTLWSFVEIRCASGAEGVGVVRRKLVADRLGELEDRLRAQAAVEVVVQDDLRQQADLVDGGHGRRCHA